MRPLGMAAAVAAAAALATIAGLEWTQRERTLVLDHRIHEEEARYRELYAVKSKIEAYQAKKRRLEEKITLIERLRGSASCPERVLSAADTGVDRVAWERTTLAVMGPATSADAASEALRGLGLTILRTGAAHGAFGVFASVPPEFCSAVGADSTKGGGS